ncbi:MAG: OprD family porin [Steroidobacteraceae bacterium]|jgi:hypothetical protein|nr:OprD family porin [Steroidobacteraceae bacterium]
MDKSRDRFGRAGTSRRPRRWPARVASLGLLALMSGGAGAQAVPSAPADPAADASQSSTEQGQTQLGESFETESDRRDRIRDQRRQAFEDTKFDVQIRSYTLDRDKYDDTDSYAWALGGSVGLKTGYFRDRFAFGLTGYTSQPLDAPDDKDGTLLLAPGQEGYAVLGEAYAQFRLADGINLDVGRKAFDTPFVNRNDNRMTPNTFEAIFVQGVAGAAATGEWRFGGGYFDEIKERNSEEFVPMSVDAGASVDRGVYAAGGNYRKGGLSIGAVDYYSDDIINIFYTEARYALPLAESRELRLGAQYVDQQATGDELLKGTDFTGRQFGLKAELVLGPALLTAAYTGTDDETSMQSPWSGYPGFTSVQVEDFNRAGEDALLLRAAYGFPKLPGLSAYVLWVNGSDPDSPTEYARDEYDFNLQWSPAAGALKGLMFRLRYAYIDQDDGSDLSDFRLMVYYDPPKL